MTRAFVARSLAVGFMGAVFAFVLIMVMIGTA